MLNDLQNMVVFIEVDYLSYTFLIKKMELFYLSKQMVISLEKSVR